MFARVFLMFVRAVKIYCVMLYGCFCCCVFCISVWLCVTLFSVFVCFVYDLVCDVV